MIASEKRILMKPNALYFYQYLPPWRIDVFNEIAKYYNLTVIFTDAESDGFTYNREDLINRLCNVKTVFLTSGFRLGSRPIRFGIMKLLRKYQPDIIFSHEYSPTSILLAALHKSKFFNFKYYLTTSDNLHIAKSVIRFKKMARSFVLLNSDGLIVYSRDVKEWYASQFPHLKIDVCPNIQSSTSLLSFSNHFPNIVASYLDKFELNGFNIVLYIGRLVEVKGLDSLIRAFANSDSESYKFKLVLVGAGEKLDELKDLAKRLGLEDKIIFAGRYDGVHLYAWYSIANFLVLPSLYEPFGAVINEALVFGCPVLASKYIGALDYIDSSNGIVFDPKNNYKFVDSLNESFKKYNKILAKRENLMNCSFENYVSCFKTIYE